MGWVEENNSTMGLGGFGVGFTPLGLVRLFLSRVDWIGLKKMKYVSYLGFKSIQSHPIYID